MISFRTLREENLAEICQIAARHHSAAFDWPKEKIISEMKSSQFFGAVDAENRLLAFVSLASRGEGVNEATFLASHPEFTRSGHMAALLQWLIASQNATSELWLEVHEGNMKARNLYRKLGFNEVGRRPSYYADQSAAILCTRIC
jgi:ribosomal protein S18 acetylase RimI-like enzyme